MTLLETLDIIGVNQDELLNRFSGNIELLERFVRKFPTDATFQKLADGVQEGDKNAIEYSAHTLKGIAASLGFQKLFETSNQMVSVVRGKAEGNLEELFDDVKTEYEKIVDCLKNLDE